MLAVAEYRVIHGYRRAFIQAGSGPALLLIHGIGDSADSWLPIMRELARSHTVIAPDLLGHGRSDKPRADYSIAAYANGMRDLLAVLNIERATVIGHSLGGGVAMQFAYQFPDKCERLVLVGSGGVSRQINPLLRFAALPSANLVLPLLRLRATRRIGNALFRLMQFLDTDLGRDAPDLARVFEALPDATARRAFVRTLRGAVDWRGQHITMLDRAYLAAGMPAMIVWGSYDAIIPYAHANLANQALPGSRLEVFEGAGHFPHRQNPQRFLALLREFLDTTEPARHSADEWRRLLRAGIAPRMPGEPARAVV